MNISQARHLLDAAREGADISQASIREALTATGDLGSTYAPREAQFLPSQQLPIDDPDWSPRPFRIKPIVGHLDAIKAILATPHGPIGMRPWQVK